MRPLIPLTLIFLSVLACGRFRGSTDTQNANLASASPAPTPIIKVTDFPAIFGKSVPEIKKMVTNGKIVYESKDSINFEFPQGFVDIDTRASGRMISFRLTDNVSGKRYDLYATTPQELANWVGIDLSKSTPDSSDFSVAYKDQKFNGFPVRISLLRKEPGKDKFETIVVTAVK